MSKKIQQRDDVFLMMTQEQHDDYTRELENKIDFLMSKDKDYITIKAKKNDYNSLLSEVLKIFRELEYNVKVEEKWTIH